MSNRFTESMATRSDAELVEIVSAPADDWQSDAVAAAGIELATRNLAPESVEAIATDIKTNEALATEPFPVWAKLLTASFPWLLVPGIVALYVYIHYQKRGQRRKARDILVWFAYGWAFFLAVLVAITLVNGGH